MFKKGDATKKSRSEATELPDDLNPKYLFNGIATDLLVGILSGAIDCKELAKQQLENRGLDNNGDWVGFNKQVLNG